MPDDLSTTNTQASKGLVHLAFNVNPVHATYCRGWCKYQKTILSLSDWQPIRKIIFYQDINPFSNNFLSVKELFFRDPIFYPVASTN